MFRNFRMQSGKDVLEDSPLYHGIDRINTWYANSRRVGSWHPDRLMKADAHGNQVTLNRARL